MQMFYSYLKTLLYTDFTQKLEPSEIDHCGQIIMFRPYIFYFETSLLADSVCGFYIINLILNIHVLLNYRI